MSKSKDPAESWQCEFCDAKNKTSVFQRNCSTCYELRDNVPISHDQAFIIFSAFSKALGESHRDFGTEMFFATTDALILLINELKRCRVPAVDHPLVGLYQSQSPGGMGMLAYLGLEVVYDNVNQIVEVDEKTLSKFIGIIEKTVTTLRESPLKYPPITEQERKFLAYQYYQELPQNVKTNPLVKHTRAPQKPKNYAQVKAELDKFQRQPSLFEEYLKKLRIDNERIRTEKDKVVQPVQLSRLQYAHRNEVRSNQPGQPCPKGADCVTAICQFSHPGGRTPMCPNGRCVSPECFLLHPYKHPNSYEDISTTQAIAASQARPTGGTGGKNVVTHTLPRVHPNRPHAAPISYPVVYGTGCYAPAKMANIECRNPVCRTYKCECAHRQFKRSLDCPEGNNCQNLAKYVYFNELTKTTSDKSSPGSKRVQNPSFCTLIHPRESRRSLGPDVEIDCPFWKELDQHHKDKVRSIQESRSTHDFIKLAPGQDLFPGCIDVFCEYNHDDQRSRDLRFYRRFEMQNPRPMTEYEPFKQGKNLATINDPLLLGENPEGSPNPFEALHQRDFSEMQGKGKWSKFNAIPEPIAAPHTFSTKPKVELKPAAPPEKLIHSFAEMAKLPKQTPVDSPNAGADNWVDPDIIPLYTSQYTQSDLDALIALMGLENCSVIHDGPFLPELEQSQQPQQQSAAAPVDFGKMSEDEQIAYLMQLSAEEAALPQTPTPAPVAALAPANIPIPQPIRVPVPVPNSVPVPVPAQYNMNSQAPIPVPAPTSFPSNIPVPVPVPSPYGISSVPVPVPMISPYAPVPVPSAYGSVPLPAPVPYTSAAVPVPLPTPSSSSFSNVPVPKPVSGPTSAPVPVPVPVPTPQSNKAPIPTAGLPIPTSTNINFGAPIPVPVPKPVPTPQNTSVPVPTQQFVPKPPVPTPHTVPVPTPTPTPSSHSIPVPTPVPVPNPVPVPSPLDQNKQNYTNNIPVPVPVPTPNQNQMQANHMPQPFHPQAQNNTGYPDDGSGGMGYYAPLPMMNGYYGGYPQYGYPQQQYGYPQQSQYGYAAPSYAPPPTGYQPQGQQSPNQANYYAPQGYSNYTAPYQQYQSPTQQPQYAPVPTPAQRGKRK